MITNFSSLFTRRPRRFWVVIATGAEAKQLPCPHDPRAALEHILNSKRCTSIALDDEIHAVFNPDAIEPNPTAREVATIFGHPESADAIRGTIVLTGPVAGDDIAGLSGTALARTTDIAEKAVDVAVPYWRRRTVLPTRGTTNGRRSTWNPRDDDAR